MSVQNKDDNGGWPERDRLPTGDPIGDVDDNPSTEVEGKSQPCNHEYVTKPLFSSLYQECTKCNHILK